MDAFSGIYLVRLDVDEWGWGVPEAGFYLDVIPIFFRLDAEGKPTGDQIDGSAWDSDDFPSTAGVLGPWFASP